MAYDDDQEDFFGGGGGAPSFKFDGIGSGVRGFITDIFVTQQVKFGTNEKMTWDDGSPRKQMNVTLQTSLRDWKGCVKPPEDEEGNPKPASEDDGLRRIYIKADMKRAVGKALSAHKLKKLILGDELAVKKSGEKDVNKGNPMSLYEARYWVVENKQTGDDFDFGDDTASAPAKQPAKAAAAQDPWTDPTPPKDPFDEAGKTQVEDEPPF